MLDWCSLYSPIDPGDVNTIVIFDGIRNQYEWKLFDDMSCLLRRTPVLRLRLSKTRSYSEVINPLSSSKMSLCYEIIETVNTHRFMQNHIAVILLGESFCDIDATASILAKTNHGVHLSFWKIIPCLNCSYSSSTYEIIKTVSVSHVTLPFIKKTRLIPDMNIVHAVTSRIVGVYFVPNNKKLYIRIDEQEKDPLKKFVSNWEKGGNVAALVTLIFMFFLMSVFACCCVFTQSALVIEDFNYRDDIHMNWRDLDNGVNNAVPQIDPQIDTTMQTEATQLSVAEPLRHKLPTDKTLEGGRADKSLEGEEIPLLE
ncbi:hypothetical protein OESDEN_01416 [Oesophagostomum dentatum]|uniref:Uncharacterized protein n=1 Tax=Oesophagostomum dentatum TaxID=61180 RepID=A0A0B1TRZ8_OESDE|nr:hypothetical protein OESDEN_01416 [Oesophagostomum dentatum]